MKTKIFWIGVLVTFSAGGQTFTETISKELSFEKTSSTNALVIANINGNVKVTAYDGVKIVVEVVKKIDAKTEARLEAGKQELQLGILDRADTILLYITDGCHRFLKKKSRPHGSGWHQGGWSYQSEARKDCNLPFDYKMDFTVKVPAALNLLISTINNGDVVIENVHGVVKANNINGGIRLTNLRREAEASTINGDLDITYRQNPEKRCRFYTLNGDINASFQPGLSANLTFQSFNGNIYSNLTKIENLPVQVNKTSRGDGLIYKINGNQFKIGNGGALLDFETFNGNVYLKEIAQ